MLGSRALVRLSLICSLLLAILQISGCRGIVGSSDGKGTPGNAAFTFTATPSAITPGSSTTLTWNAANETSVTIDNGVGTFPASGSITVSPKVTTTYNATATGPDGTKTAVARVFVGTIAIQQFTANPTAIGQGAVATLTWNVKGADSVSIDNGVGKV